MKILDYYLNKQEDPSWYNNFQSISDKCDGKLYQFKDTNFRMLASFFSQLDSFKKNDGLKRSQWSTMECGQEKDKHRIVKLKNAGLIINNEDEYYITEKGKEVLRLNDYKELKEREKWMLLLILLIDYKTEESDMVIIKSAIFLAETLSKYDIDRIKLIKMLKDVSDITKKEELFTKDIFWLTNFYKDEEFLTLYTQSTEADKTELFDYVSMCSKDKKSKDCIAHKYVNGGTFSATMFNDDINITLCVLVIAAIKDTSWDGFISLISKFYLVCDEKIKHFMDEYVDIYNDVYNRTFGSFN